MHLTRDRDLTTDQPEGTTEDVWSTPTKWEAFLLQS